MTLSFAAHLKYTVSLVRCVLLCTCIVVLCGAFLWRAVSLVPALFGSVLLFLVFVGGGLVFLFIAGHISRSASGSSSSKSSPSSGT